MNKLFFGATAFILLLFTFITGQVACAQTSPPPPHNPIRPTPPPPPPQAAPQPNFAAMMQAQMLQQQQLQQQQQALNNIAVPATQMQPSILTVDQTPFINPMALGQNMTPAETGGNLFKMLDSMPDIPDIDTSLIEGREYLLDPANKIAVDLLDYKLHVEPGSKVLVVQRGERVAICNLYDKRNGAVRVNVNNKLLNVTPGQQLVLTKNAVADFDRSNPSFGISYGNLREHDLGNGVTAFVSDFSIISAIQTSRTLQAMLKSDKREHKVAVRQLLRNAVMISSLSSGPTAFKNSYQVLSARNEWPSLEPTRVARSTTEKPAPQHLD